MKAGLYARVSREEQAEGYSIDEQLHAMREFCQARRWEIAAEYIEPGVSGTTEDRPAFQEALSDAETGKYNILVTHQLDRFFRNLQLQLETLGQLGQWNVSYVSVTEQIDYSTPQGMLFLSMLGAFNEYYVANLRRETIKGKRARAREGLSNSSIAPYGYRREEDNDVFQVDKAEAEVIRLAFELYATGTHSDLTVAEELNKRGYKPSGRSRSGKWTREGLRYLLDNPFYKGKVRHQDKTYDGLHEPIVDEELWGRVQRMRRRRGMKKGRGGGRRKEHKYLLAQLVKCSHCGLNMHSLFSGGRSRRGQHHYYRCPSRLRGFDCPTDSVMVPVAPIDEQVSELVTRLHLPEDWRDRLDAKLRQERSSPRKAGSAASRLGELERKLARAKELYIDGDLTREAYDERKWALEKERDLLEEEAELYEIEAGDLLKAGEILATLHEDWENTSLNHRNKMLKLIFEAVYVDSIKQELVAVVPNPEFVALFRMDGLEESEDGRFYLEPESGSAPGHHDRGNQGAQGAAAEEAQQERRGSDSVLRGA